MKTEYTLGPWKYSPDPLGEIAGMFIIGDQDREFIAKIEDISDLNILGGTNAKLRTHAKERAQANARLISAAPDLLEALEELQEKWKSQGYWVSAANDKAEAAIKKARGL